MGPLNTDNYITEGRSFHILKIIITGNNFDYIYCTKYDDKLTCSLKCTLKTFKQVYMIFQSKKCLFDELSEFEKADH